MADPNAIRRAREFFNYPHPLEGPRLPYSNDHEHNPSIRGRKIKAAAFLMELSGTVRGSVWKNAGFGSLRKIARHIEDYEPWFEPTIVPTPPPPAFDLAGPSGTTPATLETSGPQPQPVYPDAKYYSVDDYHKLYLSGTLTPLDVAKALLPLIRRDTNPPGEHSIAWFDTKAENVLAAAKASTLRYKKNASRGPLDGVPTAVKDEYDVPGYSTCLGSKNDYTGTATEDGANTSWCVRRLEAAGALILGKLSMHEFGLDTTGNNPVYGTPRNPYNYNYYTGGSSSGTGYAVSAGLIPIGLGSDGGGSIRIPASMCSVFGLKPTHGRISFSPGQNHCVTCAVLGPMASDVQSLARLFEVMATPHPSSRFPPLRTLSLQPSPGQPKILGIPKAWMARSTQSVRQLVNTLTDRLVSQHGWTTVDIEIPFLAEGQTAHAMTVLNDAATLLPDTRNLTPANKIMIAIGRATPATDFLLAQKLRRLLMQHLSYLWSRHPGMLILTPTTSCAGWPIRSESELVYGVSDGDRTLQSMEYAWLANFCGLPAISVPAGFIAPEGAPTAGRVVGRDAQLKIPVGLMASGEWCSEEQLLQFGLDAEHVGADRRARPPIWVDVIEKAYEHKS